MVCCFFMCRYNDKPITIIDSIVFVSKEVFPCVRRVLKWLFFMMARGNYQEVVVFSEFIGG